MLYHIWIQFCGGPMSLLVAKSSHVVSLFILNDNSPKSLDHDDRRRLCFLYSALILQGFIPR